MKTYKNIEIYCNAIARSQGISKCTKHIFSSNVIKPTITQHVSCGYRKYKDGQYVPKAYVRKAWSTVYYQKLLCEITLPASIMLDKEFILE